MQEKPDVKYNEELNGDNVTAESSSARPETVNAETAQETVAAEESSAVADVPEENISDGKKGRKRSFRSCYVFIAALGLLTVLAWIIPLRPKVSESERRALEEFPKYETDALFSGEYFRAIENWFSDTFTFREDWIGMSDGFKKLFGIRTVALYGDMPVVDDIPIPALVPATEDQSETEPAEADAVEIEPAETDAVEIEPAETELLEEDITDSVEPDADVEEEPEEEEWGGIIVDDELIADRGAKLQIGDAMFVFPGFNKTYAEKYAKRMNKTAELLKGKANFYCVLAPHAVSSMLTKEDRAKYGFVIEEDALNFLYGMMSEDVGKVNVLENLQKHNSEYITFRSDPHWTALGAYYAYEVWCEAAGKEPVPLSEYKEYAFTGFLGSYYNNGGRPKVLKDNPDTVYAYEPPGDVHMYLDFTNSLKKKGTEKPLLADRSWKKTGDHYLTFLSTDAAKATFINNDIDDDSAVLVMKTSFGNPFVYYLTQHYHYVYVCDFRYYKYSLSKFINANKVDDVILIHNTDLCYNENGLKKVSQLLK